MAFPTTGVLDTFNRANEGPPPSTSWDYPVDSSIVNGISVVSNTAGKTTSSFGAAYWKTSFGPDSEVYCTISTLPGNGVDCFLNLRMVSTGSGGSGGSGADGYSASFVNQSGSDELIYWRIDNAAYTQLGSTQTPGNLTVGDKVGLEMIGSTLQAYRYTGGSWASYGTSETSGTYTAAGVIAAGFGDFTGRLDDFGGGTVVTGQTVTPSTASLTLTTFAPTVTTTNHKTATPSTASLTLTTFAPTVTASDHKTVTPGAASLTLSTFAPTVSVTSGTVVTPDPVALALTTFAPTVTASDHQTVTPEVASFTLSTFAPTVTASDHKTVTPGVASLALSTFAPTVTVESGTVCTPGPASLTLTTYAPTVEVSIDDVPVVLIGGDDAPRRRKPRTRKEQHDLFREIETSVHQLLHPDDLEVGAGSVTPRSTEPAAIEQSIQELYNLSAGNRDLLRRVESLRAEILVLEARRQRELEQDEEDALLWLF